MNPLMRVHNIDLDSYCIAPKAKSFRKGAGNFMFVETQEGNVVGVRRTNSSYQILTSNLAVLFRLIQFHRLTRQ